jgi:hypothetical protein
VFDGTALLRVRGLLSNFLEVRPTRITPHIGMTVCYFEKARNERLRFFDSFGVSVHSLHVAQLMAVVGRQFQGKRSSIRLIGCPLDIRSSTFCR